MRGTLFLALAAALLCCGCGASAQYVANPQMRMQMMPQMQMAEQSPFTAMAAGQRQAAADKRASRRPAGRSLLHRCLLIASLPRSSLVRVHSVPLLALP